MLDYDAEKCCSNESRGAGYPKETNNNRVSVILLITSPGKIKLMAP